MSGDGTFSMYSHTKPNAIEMNSDNGTLKLKQKILGAIKFNRS